MSQTKLSRGSTAAELQQPAWSSLHVTAHHISRVRSGGVYELSFFQIDHQFLGVHQAWNPPSCACHSSAAGPVMRTFWRSLSVYHSSLDCYASQCKRICNHWSIAMPSRLHGMCSLLSAGPVPVIAPAWSLSCPLVRYGPAICVDSLQGSLQQ